MKKSKIIAPALGVLLLSTAASITGTVAWFSASKQATVTGMKVEVNTASDMLIGQKSAVCTSGSNQNAIDVDSTAFKNALTVTDDAVTLSAASSINGQDFFKENASITGNGSVDPTAQGNKYAVATNDNDNTYYARWDFVVKYANFSSTDDDEVWLKQLNLTYSESVDPSRAFRVAMLTTACYNSYGSDGIINGSEIGKDSQGVDAAEESQGVYKPTNATNFGDIAAADAVSYADVDEYNAAKLAEDPEWDDIDADAFDALDADAKIKTPAVEAANMAVNGVNSLGAVEVPEAPVYTCPHGETTFFQLSVILWIEGEDTTCRNTVFLELDGEWTLDFQLVSDKATGASSTDSLLMKTTNA